MSRRAVVVAVIVALVGAGVWFLGLLIGGWIEP